MPRRAAVHGRRSTVVSPPSRASYDSPADCNRALGAPLLLPLGVDPVHLLTQALAHDLHLVPSLLGAHALEVLLTGPILGDPLAREVARLDLRKDLLHRRPRLLADDPRPAGHVAVFGGVGDRVAHAADPLLVHQVD